MDETPENMLKYQQIDAAYVYVDGEYREIKRALDDKSLTFEQLEAVMQQAIDDGAATQSTFEDGRVVRVNIADSDAYHRVVFTRIGDVINEVAIGYLVNIPQQPYLVCTD